VLALAQSMSNLPQLPITNYQLPTTHRPTCPSDMILLMGIPTFVLASASPARRRLLQSAGIDPIVQSSDFDESQIQLSDPSQLVQTLAQRKAETVASQFTDALVLGCDSVLLVNGEIHGKPSSAEEAIALANNARSSW
jgi:septum formation protein